MTLNQRDLRMLVGIRQIIAEQFTYARWSELATLTSCEDIVHDHETLLKGLLNNWVAYPKDTLEVIKEISSRDRNNLNIICHYVRLPQWLKENDYVEYAELFGHNRQLFDDLRSRAVASSFDLNPYLQRIQDDIDSDPELAIGSMKELLESLMKSILVARGETQAGNEDLPDLLKRTQKTLNLDPNDFDDSTTRGGDLVKRTLSNLGQVVNGIAQLRNLYGTGHGRRRQSGVSPRHARLVVNSGAALAVFLVETFQYHQTEDN